MAQEQKKKLLLSGPMQGIENRNFAVFTRAAAKLRAAGYYVFNPVEADAGPAEASRENLVFLATEADGIAMLPGWHRSAAARAEYHAALASGLKVYLLDEEGEYAGEVEYAAAA